LVKTVSIVTKLEVGSWQGWDFSNFERIHTDFGAT